MYIAIKVTQPISTLNSSLAFVRSFSLFFPPSLGFLLECQAFSLRRTAAARSFEHCSSLMQPTYPAVVCDCSSLFNMLRAFVLREFLKYATNAGESGKKRSRVLLESFYQFGLVERNKRADR